MLLSGGDLLYVITGNAVKFAYRALNGDRKGVADKLWMRIRQLQRGIYTHDVQAFCKPTAYSPDFVDRDKRHQPSLAFTVAQVNHARVAG
ncbi:hypothetical protein LFREDSHE_27090 [Shewanella baltica]